MRAFQHVTDIQRYVDHYQINHPFSCALYEDTDRTTCYQDLALDGTEYWTCTEANRVEITKGSSNTWGNRNGRVVQLTSRLAILSTTKSQFVYYYGEVIP